jgi:hypothetical protein
MSGFKQKPDGLVENILFIIGSVAQNIGVEFED